MKAGFLHVRDIFLSHCNVELHVLLCLCKQLLNASFAAVFWLWPFFTCISHSLLLFSLASSVVDNFIKTHSTFGFGSWLLYLLGMLGMGSIHLHFSWNVPGQPSCEPWNSGMVFVYFVDILELMNYESFIFSFWHSLPIAPACDLYSCSRNHMHICKLWLW